MEKNLEQFVAVRCVIMILKLSCRWTYGEYCSNFKVPIAHPNLKVKSSNCLAYIVTDCCLINILRITLLFPGIWSILGPRSRFRSNFLLHLEENLSQDNGLGVGLFKGFRYPCRRHEGCFTRHSRGWTGKDGNPGLWLNYFTKWANSSAQMIILTNMASIFLKVIYNMYISPYHQPWNEAHRLRLRDEDIISRRN